MSDVWDLQAELAKAPRGRPQDRIIHAMWCYNKDLRYAGDSYAQAKTEHDRVLARAIVQDRNLGEKSAEVAAHRAIAGNDEVYQTRLTYRVAEQRIVADREALRTLHAQLDDLRTQAADARAANTFEAHHGT